MKHPLRVVKVGGSLFDLPNLAVRLKAWIDAEPLASTVLVAGGGEMAEVIRRAQSRHRLSDQSAHWLCIEAMGITAQWLTALLENPPCLSCLSEVAEMAAQARPASHVFDPRRFLKQDEARLGESRLPENWSVTSDSIAARLAVALHAEELILLKSQPAPNHEHLQQLADTGYVDAFFPQAAKNLPQVSFVNLRSWTQESSPAV